MIRSIALFATLAVASSAAHAEANGVLTEVLGRAWPVRDALAFRDGERTLVVLTSEPFDWIDFAADGKLDTRDLGRHRGRGIGFDTIEFTFDAKGYFRAWDSEDFEEGRNPVGGWKQVASDATRVAGAFDYASTNATFDVEIRGATLAPIGETLASDSEPVRALQAYFTALKKGDVQAALSASMTAQELAGVDAEQRARFAAALKPGPLSVKRIEFREGRIAGNVAHIDYAAWADIVDGKVRRARMAMIDGRWLVRDEIMD